MVYCTIFITVNMSGNYRAVGDSETSAHYIL